MEVPKYYCYKMNRVFLLLVGLWPYGDSFRKQIIRIFCIAMLVSSAFVQLLKLFTMEYDLNLALTNMSLTLPFIVYIVKYTTCFFQPAKIRKLLEKTRSNWNMLKNEQEVEIMERYSKVGKNYMYGFVAMCYPGTFGFIIMQAMPDILDIVMPLNESRPRALPFMAEYFLDQQKYFYLVFFHMNASITVGITSLVAAESLLFMSMHHACSLFEVVSYRIEDALTVLSTLNGEDVIRMKIIDAVKVHQEALEFYEYLMATFNTSYFILIFFGIASLSINLFRLVQVAVAPNPGEDFILFLSFVFGHFYYMFICNYLGQKVTDSSGVIYEKICDTQWYVMPVQTQKLLLFVMQRSMKSCKFVMGGIFPVSLENFTSLTSTSLSYFTVIYSAQQ